MQPVYKDKNGTLRFKENKIVSYLLAQSSKGIKCDMNIIAQWCNSKNISDEDQQQFAQLIGYGVSDYGGLSYVLGSGTEELAIKSFALPEQSN